jgi:hypothetical protein
VFIFPRAASTIRWPQRALRLGPRDPFSPIYYCVAACAQFVGKNYAEAISLSREASNRTAPVTLKTSP